MGLNISPCITNNYSIQIGARVEPHLSDLVIAVSELLISNASRCRFFTLILSYHGLMLKLSPDSKHQIISSLYEGQLVSTMVMQKDRFNPIACSASGMVCYLPCRAKYYFPITIFFFF